MNIDALDRLLVDRALEELDSDVRELVDAYLCDHPAAIVRADELAKVLALARSAVASPAETAVALPPWRPPQMAPVRGARSELLRLAACLLLGGIAGWMAQSLREPPAFGPPPAAVAHRGTRPVNPALAQPAFWSVAHLVRVSTAPRAGTEAETRRLRLTLFQRIPQSQEKP